MKRHPTPEYLREAVEYDAATGLLTWRERPLHHFANVAAQRRANTTWAGKPAFATVSWHGYRVGRFEGANFLAHRVIWAMTYGYWPSQEIDHQDGDRLNNRLDNLREATPSQNRMNGAARPNKTGFKGVKRHRDRYEAGIKVNGRPISLGSFETAEQAHAAYCAAARHYFGEFARAA